MSPENSRRGSQADRYRVPIYAVSSWTSIVSLQASSWIVPIRDIYEVPHAPIDLRAISVNPQARHLRYTLSSNSSLIFSAESVHLLV